MTMALLSGPTLDSTGDEIEAEAASAPLFRSQDLLVVTMTVFGVLLSSALGTLLFLR
jgi:hypothetical protein